MQRIHGLVVQAGVPLPGLPRAERCSADVVFELDDRVSVPAATVFRYRSGSADDPTARVEISDDSQGHTYFRYGDGTTFDVAHRLRPATIRASIAPGQTLEDLSAYLYGPVLGFILRAWGRLALHASCVKIGDQAVLIAGDSGSGKSTTAAALAMRGVRVLSDDLTALSTRDDGRLLAWPSFDHLRLWSDSEQIVLGGSGQLERITPTWDKRRFPLAGNDFAPEPCPVGAIVVLRPRGPRSRAIARTMAPPRALLALTTLTYANYLLDTPMRAIELGQLGALVRSVPVLAVSASAGPAGLDDLCDAILRAAARRALVRA